MDPIQLEEQALIAIQDVLKDWDIKYLNGETQTDQSNAKTTQTSLESTKWIYYTKHIKTTSEKSLYETVFSQPTSTRPIPRATASISFIYTANGDLHYQFETNRLLNHSKNVTTLGSPAKRLKEIVKSKEQTADSE